LKIVVCVKVVPKSEEIRVDPDTMMLIREGVRSEINPPDMNALEMALSLKDLHGGEVNILSMGPPSFVPFLQVGVAMGADHIYLLSDFSLAGADTLATTYTLSKGIEKLEDVDLVFCGEESSDGATGQVPSGLAEWLEIEGLTLTTRIELDCSNRSARGRRETAGGYEILEVPLPCVVSVKTACNEPRFMDYSRKKWAFENERVTIWGAAEIEADPDFIGLKGSPTIVSGLDQAPVRDRKRQFLEGSPAEIASQIADILLQNS
jgi:electron transfer flavoprotein beta subunit